MISLPLEDRYLPSSKDPWTLRGGDTFPQFASQRGGGMACRIPRGWAFAGTCARCCLLRSSTSPRKRTPGVRNIRLIGTGRSPDAAAQQSHLPAPRRSEQADMILGVCPGAEYGPAKRWPVERFRETMEIVSEKTSCSWVILGTENDQALAAEILRGFAGEAEDLTGKTSLDELIEQASGSACPAH